MGNYELHEVAAPYGYVLSNEPVPFPIDGSEATVTVTQYNMPQKGQITITKTGVPVTSSDKVLTLSTCTNVVADRFIVMGRLVDVTE